jgi:transposase
VERVGLRLQLRKQQAEAGDIILLYGDESEALTHPYLARAWAKSGADLRVPAPGQAKKVAMLGSFDHVKIGGVDRQTLRDWVHRFNAAGPDGLFDNWTDGPTPRLSPEQLDELAKIVESGPDRKVHGVVRWRRIDLSRVIAERFGVDYHQRYVGKLLKKLGFSHMSARPRHPAQDEQIVEAFKKTSRAR